MPMEEKPARFGHHPIAGIDFGFEVEEIENIFRDSQLPDSPSPLPDGFAERVGRAMTFRVGGDVNCIDAKQLLRKVESQLCASKKQGGKEWRETIATARTIILNCVAKGSIADKCVAGLTAMIDTTPPARTEEDGLPEAMRNLKFYRPSDFVSPQEHDEKLNELRQHGDVRTVYVSQGDWILIERALAGFPVGATVDGTQHLAGANNPVIGATSEDQTSSSAEAQWRKALQSAASGFDEISCAGLDAHIGLHT